MASWSFFPIDAEKRHLGNVQLGRDQKAQGRQMANDQGLIQRLSGINRSWGWLPPSAKLGFAEAGMDADHPAVKDAAQLELKRQARSQQIGRDIKKIGGDQGPGLFHKMSDQQVQQAKQSDGGGGGGGILGTGIGPDLGPKVDLGYSAQRLLRGDLPGAIAGGGAEQAGAGDVQHDITAGGVNLTAGARGLARQAGVVAAAPFETGYGFIRSGATGIEQLATGQGLHGQAETPEQLAPYQSQLGQEGLAATRGEPIDLGKGWLPDPNSQVAQAAHRTQLQAGPVIAGHAFTLGRLAASTLNVAETGLATAANTVIGGPVVPGNIIDPGSFGYSLVSGGVDAGVAMQADPAAAFLGSTAETRLARGRFAPAAEDINTAMAAAEKKIGGGSNVLDYVLATTGRNAKQGFEHKPETYDALARQDPHEYLNAIRTDYGGEVANEVQKQYEQAGAMIGSKPFVNHAVGPTPDQWMDQPVGNTVMNAMAKETDASKLVRRFGLPAQAANGEPIAANASKITDVNELKQYLRPFLGPDIQSPIKLPGGVGYAVQRGLAASPTMERTLTGMYPDFYALPDDKNSMYQNLDRVMLAGNVPQERRDQVLNQLLNANGPDETFQAAKSSSDALKEMLTSAGMKDQKRINELANVFPDALNQERLYWADPVTGLEKARPGVIIDAEGHVLPRPMLTTEGMNRMIPLPDPRELRRATSKFAPLVDSAPWKATSALTDQFLGVWRTVHLMRPGLAIRIIADSQASLAANGMDSLFSHPLNTISAIVGGNMDKTWAQTIARFPGVEPLLGKNIMNEDIINKWDEVERAIHGAFGSVGADPGRIALAGFHPTYRSDPNFAGDLADELGRMSNDPRVRGVLAQPTPEAAKDWFWNGEGGALRQKYIGYADQINEANKAKALTLPGSEVLPLDFRTKPGSDSFVDSILERVHDTTGGHPELRQAIVDGKLAGKSLSQAVGGSRAPNQDAVDYLKTLTDAGAGPNVTKGRDYALIGSSAQQKDRALKTQAVRKLFDHMIMEPDANLDRIPAYQQAYWKRAADYMPYLDTTPVKVGGTTTTLRDLVLQRAEDNLPQPSWFSEHLGGNAQDMLTRLRNTPVDTGARKLNLDQFHTLTKSAALDEIPRLVHDLSSRSQFFDMTRLLFPFGDAFRRIASRWAQTIWEHPNVLRRAEQGITAARQSGFFHVDPTTGQEVFTYPGSQFITDKLFGVPIPLTGAVGGLSMVGEGLPGVGPALSIPAKYFMPDVPQLDAVRKQIFPYGEPPNVPGGIGDEVLQATVPAWADKLSQGLTGQYHDQKRYNTITGAIWREKASSGEYDLFGEHGKDPAQEQARLLQDSKEAAKWFYVVQGLAQSTSPSSPTAEWKAKDKSGRWVTQAAIVDDYRKQLTKSGPDGAMGYLINHYGENNAFLAQAFSKPVVYGIPVTKQANDWIASNPGVADKYPNTYGFAAPQQGKFDIMSFEQQFVGWERKSIPLSGEASGEDQTTLANNRIGMWKYHQALDSVLKANNGDAPDAAQTADLNDYKKHLMQTHPGFGLVTFDLGKLPRQVSELTRMAKDPGLQSQDAIQGLRMYLDYRKQADAEARDAGFVSKTGAAFGRAKAMADVRDTMRQAAAYVIKQHPDFSPMWEQVFSHEMVSDVGRGGTS